VKKVLVSVLVVLFLLPAASEGQEPLFFGVRLATSSGLGNLGPTNMQGGYFGLQFKQRYTAFAGIDFSKFVADNESRTSMSLITPFTGFKFFFHRWYKGSVTQFVKGEIFKSTMRWPNLGDAAALLVNYFPATSDVSLTQIEAEEFLKEILSPWGINFSFGAEYYFSEQFSLGGEFGLRNGFSKAEVILSDTETLFKTNASYHDTYVAMTLSFLI
jgi:hypothetical protein